MSDIKFLEMTVEEIKTDNNRTSIKANGGFYSFFQMKKDGQESRAQADFKKLGVEEGKTYSFGITENVKEGQDGKTMVFKNICLISELRQKPLNQ